MRARNRVTVLPVISLATLVWPATLAFLFTSERGGNNCFRRIVQRDRFSYRSFSLNRTRVGGGRRFSGWLRVANVWTFYEGCLNAPTHTHTHIPGATPGTPSVFSFRTETVIPRGNTALSKFPSVFNYFST